MLLLKLVRLHTEFYHTFRKINCVYSFSHMYRSWILRLTFFRLSPRKKLSSQGNWRGHFAGPSWREGSGGRSEKRRRATDSPPVVRETSEWLFMDFFCDFQQRPCFYSYYVENTPVCLVPFFDRYSRAQFCVFLYFRIVWVVLHL